ncbi:MAG: OmpA family protein [Proteobacteria bacterium]|nr:OmpA family protein [Pseudomonadota bacterium]
MNVLRMRSRGRADWRRQALGWACAAAVLAALAPGAGAQYDQTVVIGGDLRPSVDVDLGVLDELGRPPTVPQLLMPHPGAPRSRLALRPPQGVRPVIPARPEAAPAPERPLAAAPEAAPAPRPAAPATRPPRPTVPSAPAGVTEERPRPAPSAVERPSRAAPAETALAERPPAGPTPPPATAAPPPPPQIAGVRAPEPRPAARAEPAAPARTAARPAAPEPGTVRLLFDKKSTNLSPRARESLEGLSKNVQGDETLRLQLLAYAEGTAETANEARRTSLSRALVVRSFLIQQGVRSTRIDVRALGNRIEDGPADRVDVILVKR